MSINDKTNVVLTGYQRGSTPVLEESIIRYLQDELQRIENSVRSLIVAGVEVLDAPPKNPIKGMLKYSVSPWDPLGDGSEGLVVYNGTAWIDV
jgi:hypothetical protein|tara:strand:+ start:2031 stop:2309 length:279 start_codon:yes stop_codon:yes gene_type:complete